MVSKPEYIMALNLKKISVLLFFLVGTTINSQNAPVSIDLEEKVFEELDLITTGKPSVLDPLALNAKIVWSVKKDQLAIILKANLLENWHIYAHTEKESPFIMTELRSTLPEGLSPIGELIKSDPFNFSEGVYVYEEELFYISFFEVNQELLKDTDVIKYGLFYQACDDFQCFPPVAKMLDLELK